MECVSSISGMISSHLTHDNVGGLFDFLSLQPIVVVFSTAQ
jgi:hypothetical protein